jgi:hypothetical protein
MVTIFLLWGSTKLAPGTNSIAHKFAEFFSPLGPPIFPQKCDDPKVSIYLAHSQCGRKYEVVENMKFPKFEFLHGHCFD